MNIIIQRRCGNILIFINNCSKIIYFTDRSPKYE